MKTEQNFTTRQTGIICFFIIIATKLLFLPSLFYQYCKSTAIVAVFLGLFFEIVTLFAIYKFIKKNNGISFYTFLANKFSKWVAKFVYLLIFIFFFTKLLFIINGSFTFVRDAVFASFDLNRFMIMIIIVCSYLAYESNRALARTCELFFPFVLIGLIFTLALGFFSSKFQIPNVDIFNNQKEIFTSNFYLITFFGDPLILLTAMDKIKFDADIKKNIFKFSFFGYAIVFVLCFIFYGIFDTSAFMNRDAIINIASFSVEDVDFGKLDFIPVITYMTIMFLQFSLFMKSCVKCLDDIFCEGKHGLKVIILNIMLIICVFFIFTSSDLTLIFAQNYISYIVLVVAYLLPLICSILKPDKNGGKYEKFFN